MPDYSVVAKLNTRLIRSTVLVIRVKETPEQLSRISDTSLFLSERWEGQTVSEYSGFSLGWGDKHDD